MKIISLLIIIIFSILLSLLVIEVGFRALAIPKIDYSSPAFGGTLYRAWKDQNFFVPSADRIYKMAPSVGADNYWRSDADGFRYNPRHAQKISSFRARKLLFIGDSYTYGHGVTHDEAYPAQLEQIFLASGFDVWVDNAGTPGYGPDQEFVHLHELLRKKTYDMIVWNFSMNDVDDNNQACLFRKTPFGRMQLPGWFNTLHLMLSYARSPHVIVQNSFTINYLIASIRGVSNTERFTFGCSQQAPTGDRLQKDFEDNVTYFKDRLEKYFRNKRLGTRLVFVFTPFRGDARVRPFLQKNNYSIMEERIDGFLKTLGVPYLDTSPIVAAVAQQKLFASKNSGENVLGASTQDASMEFFLDEKQYGDYSHLNAAGNALLAKIVAEWIAPILQ